MEKNLANCGFAQAGTVSDTGELIPHKLYHPYAGRDYEIDESTYIRVGAYGIDDLEFKFTECHTSVQMVETGEMFESVQVAYEHYNDKWIEQEDNYMEKSGEL